MKKLFLIVAIISILLLLSGCIEKRDLYTVQMKDGPNLSLIEDAGGRDIEGRWLNGYYFYKVKLKDSQAEKLEKHKEIMTVLKFAEAM